MRRILILPCSSILRVVFCVCLCCKSLALAPISKPNCQETCGNITIPYPFGVSSSCSANSSFLVICRNDSTLFLPSINMEVMDISLQYSMITVKNPVTPLSCTKEKKTVSMGEQFVGSPFKISSVRNAFAVFGCQNSGFLNADETDLGGCVPSCRRLHYENESCSGVNCCQLIIPRGSHVLKYDYQTIIQDNNDTGLQFCGYAFPVDNGWLGYDYGLYKGLRDNFSSPFDEELVYAPLVLDWEFSGAVISNYAICYYIPQEFQHYDGSCGFSQFGKYTYYDYGAEKCWCCVGFEGNPYLGKGCVDIDECEDSQDNPCTLSHGTCINKIGSYRCEYQDPNTRVRNIILITIGSLLGAGIFIPCLSRIIIKRLKARQRRKFFVSNGGLLLEQKLSSTDNEYKKSKLFGSEELAQATDHYNENRILGRGGQGIVYKGMLTDGSIVAVKKSIKVEHQGDSEIFINEVIILSQIIHRNIVRLLGCCLETQVPLLVYEFISNGTLFQHIHEPSDDDIPLTWEMRLRIAIEVAGALAYLHSSTSAPIFHRDIKSTNILLDENYRAKISDFGTSRSVAIDQTHFTTRVLGTYGYLDPEYFQSNQFTEKSDVYSFGVVMVELLTGERAISSLRAEMGRSLATYFLRSMEEDKLFDIVDARIEPREGKRGEIVAVAELSRRCLHLNGKLRPTMRQVASELESIHQVNNSSTVLERNHDYRYYGVSDSVEPTTDQTYDCSSLLSLTLER